jgi:hypothetical protein
MPCAPLSCLPMRISLPTRPSLPASLSPGTSHLPSCLYLSIYLSPCLSANTFTFTCLVLPAPSYTRLSLYLLVPPLFQHLCVRLSACLPFSPGHSRALQKIRKGKHYEHCAPLDVLASAPVDARIHHRDVRFNVYI